MLDAEGERPVKQELAIGVARANSVAVEIEVGLVHEVALSKGSVPAATLPKARASVAAPAEEALVVAGAAEVDAADRGIMAGHLTQLGD